MNKIIHQIFLDIGLKPLKDRPDYLKNIELLKKNNPDWEHKLWDDKTLNKFVEMNYPEYLEIWNSFPHPFYKIDYSRYLLLKKYGGIYIDLDEENIKKFDDKILDCKIITGVWIDKKNNKHNYNTNNTIAINDKVLIQNLIDYCNSQIIEKKKSLPPTWKCRLLQHSVGQIMFTRWCKLNKLNSDINILEYLKMTDEENGSWITSMGRKIK
tara:strand:+ start:7575 stop:8207 length:633 start_codon:yes stop_codon:yes gene_type:complete